MAQLNVLDRAPKRTLTPMVLVLLCCLAPVAAAFLVYYNPQWWPGQSSNYGALIEPQRPVPGPSALQLTTLEGAPFDLNSLKGKWLLVSAGEAACPESCARQLFITRNSHASQGKHVDRLARVWFVTDDGPVPEKVLRAYQGTIMLRADPEQLAAFLLSEKALSRPAPPPADSPERTVSLPTSASPSAQSVPSAAEALSSPIWVIDPLGNLMLQFPPDADGVRVRKDISKLVYNSRIG